MDMQEKVHDMFFSQPSVDLTDKSMRFKSIDMLFDDDGENVYQSNEIEMELWSLLRQETINIDTLLNYKYSEIKNTEYYIEGLTPAENTFLSIHDNGEEYHKFEAQIKEIYELFESNGLEYDEDVISAFRNVSGIDRCDILEKIKAWDTIWADNNHEIDNVIKKYCNPDIDNETGEDIKDNEWTKIFERLAIVSGGHKAYWKECEKIRKEFHEPEQKGCFK